MTRVRDKRRIRQQALFADWGVRHRDVRHRDALDRTLERAEAFVGNDGSNLARRTAAVARLVHYHQMTGLFDGADDGGLVERDQGPGIDHLDHDALFRQLARRLERVFDHVADRDYRRGLPITQNRGFPERHQMIAIRNLTLSRRRGRSPP